MFALFLFMERGRSLAILRSLRWPALAVALLSAAGMITGIGALRYTTVADAMVIYATVPFVTAALAYLVIGERPSRSTLIGSTVALLGVGVMLWGAEMGGSLFGQFLAVLMTLSMAGFTTIMRKHRDVPMLPAMALSAWICSLRLLLVRASRCRSRSTTSCSAPPSASCRTRRGWRSTPSASKRVPAAEATLAGRPRSAVHAALGVRVPGRNAVAPDADRRRHRARRPVHAHPVGVPPQADRRWRNLHRS